MVVRKGTTQVVPFVVFGAKYRIGPCLKSIIPFGKKLYSPIFVQL